MVQRIDQQIIGHPVPHLHFHQLISSPFIDILRSQIHSSNTTQSHSFVWVHINHITEIIGG